MSAGQHLRLSRRVSRRMSAIARYILSMVLPHLKHGLPPYGRTMRLKDQSSDSLLIDPYASTSDLGIYEGVTSPFSPTYDQRSIYRQTSQEYEFKQLLEALEDITRSLDELTAMPTSMRQLRDPIVFAVQDVTLRDAIQDICGELVNAYRRLPVHSPLRTQYVQRMRDIKPALV